VRLDQGFQLSPVHYSLHFSDKYRGSRLPLLDAKFKDAKLDCFLGLPFSYDDAMMPEAGNKSAFPSVCLLTLKN
jgi:hypothetical protein